MKTKIIELEEIDSTNDFCKRFPMEESLIVTAKRQTGGRGTKGRSFVSDEGGLYVSVMNTFKNFKFENTFSIMINSCVAVCETLKHFGIAPNIKWANDVLVNGKKICGTLIENRLCADNVCVSIVGIGLNVNNVLPRELSDIATTMRECRGRRLNLKSVRTQLIKNLQNGYTVEDYKAYVDWFGKDVYLDGGGAKVKATALDVDGGGNLICNVGGEIKKISNGEMSLRLKCNAV